MQIVKESGTFQAPTSTGDVKYWVHRILQDDQGLAYTQSESWRSTAKSGEGKHVIATPKLIKGKNEGKSNATTSLSQALKEFDSKLVEKRKEGYYLEGEAPPELLLPMKALKYGVVKRKLPAFIYMQPKLDGVRCITSAEKSWSKLGNDFPKEIVEHLRVEVGDLILDGELILPPPYTFQDTIKAVKKFRPEMTPLLEYHLYDLMDLTGKLTYTERLTLLKAFVTIVQVKCPQIKLVESVTLASDHEKIVAQQAIFVAQNYEGAMIRVPSSFYKIGFETPDLLKVKDRDDDEFIILGAKEGEGKEAGCAIFIMDNGDGQTFDATPNYPEASRRKMWIERASLVGKPATITFQGRSDGGVPRFPKFKSVRDFE